MTAVETSPQGLPKTEKPSSSQRLLSLDVLRALAIALVLVRHFAVDSTLQGSISQLLREMPGPAGYAAGLVAIVYRAGWVGVDLFFVLSGFLVSGLLFNEHKRTGTIQIKRFLIRRGFKIYPSFYAFLLITTLILYVTGTPPPARLLAGEVLFLQNYLGKMFNHTWSLAVEEHFYLLLAALFFFLSRRRTADPYRVIPALFVILAALVLFFRVIHARGTSFDFDSCVQPTHFRIDSLFFGVVIAFFFSKFPQQFVSIGRGLSGLTIPLGFLGLILLPVAIPLHTPGAYTFGFTLLYLAAGMLLWGVVSLGIPSNAVTRFLGYIGAHSYPIYLWHMPVFNATHYLLNEKASLITQAVVGTVLSLAIGIVFSKLLEYPTLRLRDRLFPPVTR